MKNKIINFITKLCIFIAIVYLLMLVNSGDIEYIYANF